MTQYTLEEIRPRIFLFCMSDQYNLNMHFLRYQEFYESPSPRFRGKSFKILDFMSWYSKKYGKGAFTYAIDWAGFNIPGSVLKRAMDAGIPDRNDYDQVMEDVYFACKQKHDGDFYLIGARQKNYILKHEVAHGFYHLNPEYRARMTALVRGLEPEFRAKFNKYLRNTGYTPKVYIDETQAYLSTGSPPVIKEVLKGEDKPFRKLYNQYYKL